MGKVFVNIRDFLLENPQYVEDIVKDVQQTDIHILVKAEKSGRILHDEMVTWLGPFVPDSMTTLTIRFPIPEPADVIETVDGADQINIQTILSGAKSGMRLYYESIRWVGEKWDTSHIMTLTLRLAMDEKCIAEQT